MMRRRGPGLVGTMARTAVIAGTATAVSGRVAERQYQRHAAAQQQAQPAPAPAAAPAEAAPADDTIAQIQQLAQLHAAGILTDEEFAAKKAQLLGI